jgi:hypothetical protein
MKKRNKKIKTDKIRGKTTFAREEKEDIGTYPTAASRPEW